MASRYVNWDSEEIFNHEILQIAVKKLLPPNGEQTPLSQKRMALYRNMMIEGDKVPLINVEYDSTKIRDGYHRYRAYLELLKISPEYPDVIPVRRWKRIFNSKEKL